jgi:hypothetical protein
MKELMEGVIELSREEGIVLFDKAARNKLGISGDEFLRRWDAGEDFAAVADEPMMRDDAPGMKGCRVYWGTHGCALRRGHDGPHDCQCCDCPPGLHPNDSHNVLCVSTAPYYGPDTGFYGEDATPATVGQWGHVLDDSFA